MVGYFLLETQGSNFLKSYSFSSGLDYSQAWVGILGHKTTCCSLYQGSEFRWLLGKGEGWGWGRGSRAVTCGGGGGMWGGRTLKLLPLLSVCHPWAGRPVLAQPSLSLGDSEMTCLTSFSYELIVVCHHKLCHGSFLPLCLIRSSAVFSGRGKWSQVTVIHGWFGTLLPLSPSPSGNSQCNFFT